jgi:pre-mRNA-splicing factor CWC26
MTDGTAAGLVPAAQVVAEAAAKRIAEAERIAQLDAAGGAGRGAGTVYRDASGRQVSAEELAALREAAALAKRGPQRERPQWAGGVAQARNAQAQREEMAAEASRPFARFADDARLDAERRAAPRWGDPLALTRKEGPPADVSLPPPGDLAALQRAGFRVPTAVPAHSWLRRGLGAPINRFGIKPGRHWDGVERGTGFEEQLFKARNERAARERASVGLMANYE